MPSKTKYNVSINVTVADVGVFFREEESGSFEFGITSSTGGFSGETSLSILDLL